jgi:DNA repair exonuclease SbcCD ATPase subunit
MTDNNYLEKMITNLGVTGISTADRNKLAQLKFTEYSGDLQDADTAIGKLQIDDNLKLELLKLQVHYLHNLDAVKDAKKKMADALAKSENHKGFVAHIRKTEGQLEEKTNELAAVRTQLADKEQQLEAVNKKNESLAHTHAVELNALRQAKEQLAHKHAEEVTALRQAEKHLADQKAQLDEARRQCGEIQNNLKRKLQELQKSESHKHSSRTVPQSHQKPEKPLTITLTDEEIQDIRELRDKLTTTHNNISYNNILKFDNFTKMFDIMYRHGITIKKIIPYRTDVNSDIKVNATNKVSYNNNKSNPNTYSIRIDINPSSYLNIFITPSNDTTNTHDDKGVNMIVYVEYDNNTSYTTKTTIITSRSFDRVIDSDDSVTLKKELIENVPLYNIAYTLIRNLLDFLFPASMSVHKNKYLKYKNKYLQLKKLYNL